MGDEKLNYAFYDENGKLLPEFKKFNFGACFLTWIWGIGNKTYITLIDLFLTFIAFFIQPIVIFHFILYIWFGIKGNEWALQNKEWKSVDHFQNVQKEWAEWGLLLFCAKIILIFVAKFLV